MLLCVTAVHAKAHARRRSGLMTSEIVLLGKGTSPVGKSLPGRTLVPPAAYIAAIDEQGPRRGFSHSNA